MYICYVDEAGCTGALPNAASQVQPVFVLAGVILRHDLIKPATVDWINLKQRYFPNLLPSAPKPLFHDWMAAEVKGNDLRNRARSTSRNKRRAAIGVLDATIALLEKYEGKIAGRIFIKPIGGTFSGTPVYTATAQAICSTFENCLEAHNSVGVVIADSRQKSTNANLSHSIFTQRHRAAGDPYPRIVEAPTFGHSDNHAGLQFADIVCSGLLFPIAAQVCCSQHLTNQMHCDAHYLDLRTRFGSRLRAMQWQYQDHPGHWVGGISLNDELNGHKVPVIFTAPAPQTTLQAALAAAMLSGGKP